MTDYVYPSIFFSYFVFFLLVFGALFFFIRSWKHGYWGRQSEDAKYRMLEDETNSGTDYSIPKLFDASARDGDKMSNPGHE